MKTRYVPTHTEKIENENYVCYIDRPHLCALCYCGKATNPTFNYRYRTSEQLDKHVHELLARYDRHYADKAERKQRLTDLNAVFDVSAHFALGDIIVNTWGYDQTNVEFYQVTQLKKKQIVVREIAQKYTERDGYSSMSSFTMPLKDEFIETAKEITLTCRACEYDPYYYIASSESYYYFHKWQGREQYVSWYA
jgi:hypothetical protein